MHSNLLRLFILLVSFVISSPFVFARSDAGTPFCGTLVDSRELMGDILKDNPKITLPDEPSTDFPDAETREPAAPPAEGISSNDRTPIRPEERPIVQIGPFVDISNIANVQINRTQNRDVRPSVSRVKRVVRQAAQEDLRTVSESFLDRSTLALKDLFTESKKQLRQVVNSLQKTKQSEQPQNKDKSPTAAEAFAYQTAWETANQVKPEPSNERGPAVDPDFAFAPLPGAKRVFDTGPTRSLAEAQTQNIIQILGLPAENRTVIYDRLKTVTSKTILLANGKTTTLAVPSFNPFKDGVEELGCAEMVAYFASSDARRAQYSSIELYALWNFLRYGLFPSDIALAKERKFYLTRAASNFIAVDPSKKEDLFPGDLVLEDRNPKIHVAWAEKVDLGGSRVKLRFDQRPGKRIIKYSRPKHRLLALRLKPKGTALNCQEDRRPGIAALGESLRQLVAKGGRL